MSFSVSSLISTAKLDGDCFSVYLQQRESVVTPGIHNNQPGRRDEDHIIPICCIGNLYFVPTFPAVELSATAPDL